MNLQTYQEAIKRTRAAKSEEETLKLAVVGLIGKLGEIADPIKKHLWYGHNLNCEHIAEELGELLWYLATLCNTLDLSLETVVESNIAKLGRRKRYQDEKPSERSVNQEDKAVPLKEEDYPLLVAWHEGHLSTHWHAGKYQRMVDNPTMQPMLAGELAAAALAVEIGLEWTRLEHDVKAFLKTDALNGTDPIIAFRDSLHKLPSYKSTLTLLSGTRELVRLMQEYAEQKGL